MTHQHDQISVLAVITAMIWFRLMVETSSGQGGVYTADMLFRLIK